MARNFTVAQSQLYSATAAGLPVTSTGTISLWYKPASFTGGSVMLYCGGTASPLRMQPSIQARYTDGSFYVGFYNAGADQRIVASATGYTNGYWHHVVFDYDGAVPSQRYYINNSLAGSSAAGFTGYASGIAGLAIGNSVDNVGADYYARGDIAEVARWDRRLTDAERTLLYQGYSPATIPSGLLRYYRLLGTSSPEPEYFGVNEPLTVTGATASAHPRIHMPSSPARGWSGGWTPIRQRTPQQRFDRAQPLVRNLKSLFPCTEGSGPPRDRIKSSRTLIATGTWTHTSHGPATPTTWAWDNNSSTDLAFLSGAWSVAAFMRVISVPTSGQFAEGYARYQYAHEFDNGGWALAARGDTSGWVFPCWNNNSSYILAGTTALAVGDWVVVGTSDGTTRRIYVNGAFEASTTNNPNPRNNSSEQGALYLSRNATANVVTHWAAAWTRALTTGEIRQLWLQRRSIGGLLVHGPVPTNMPGVLTSTVSPRIRPFGRRKPL